MKNIYFIEAGFSFDNDIYLPYSTGTIAAFLKKKGCFNEKFNLAGFFYRREKTDSIVEKLDKPYIVGFSCCIWNQQFNIALAAKIKAHYPECIIVFGGHNITSDSDFLTKHPFIDILITGEGERTFYSVLEGLDKGSLFNINNIIFRYKDNIVFTPCLLPEDLSVLPSPYTTGIFDSILETENHSSLLCVLETNRGCPYSCSYCDWCSGKKVRMFPMGKILAEITWMAQQKIEYCFCADSNFGMFTRDIEIADFAASTKEKFGFPQVFRTCFAKESNDNVFRISKILNSAKMDKGATLAYQTLSEDALKNINRKNLTLEHFSDLLKKYNEAGIPTYSELILGLPGETKESFCNGICKILESGQHNSLSIYYLEMLPNSEMSQKSYISKHKLNSIKIEFNHMHSSDKDNEITEYSDIVQSTATLSKEDWVYCNLFSICIQSFHALGFLRFFALYLNKEKNISYYSFYSDLLEHILSQKGSSVNKLFMTFRDKLSTSLSGEWNYKNSEFGDVSWAFEEGAYMTMLKDSETVMNELEGFLSKYFTDKELFNELCKYQQMSLRKPGIKAEKAEFHYDFMTFFDKIQMNIPCRLTSENALYHFSSDKLYTDWKIFSKEIVWFGRRKGATIISGRPNSGTFLNKELLSDKISR